MALTPVIVTGWEHGLPANNADAQNGAGLGDAVAIGAGGSITALAAAARSGLYGLRILLTATAATRIVFSTSLFSAGNRVFVCRFYFKYDANPGTNPQQILRVVSGTTGCPRFEITTGGNLQCIMQGGTTINYSTNGGVSAQTLSTGTWYRVEFYIDTSANPWVCKWRVGVGDGAPIAQTDTTAALAAADLTSLSVGTSSTTNSLTALNCDYDDLFCGKTAVDYTGTSTLAAKVLAVRPSSDGVHSPATPDCIRGGGASPALIGGGNAAWQYLDDDPFPHGVSPTTDRINQDTLHATHYVEVVNGPTIVGTASGVMAVLAYGGDSVTANSGSTVVIDSANAENAVFGSSAVPADMSETSVFFKSKMLTPPAAGWTKAEIDALKWRIGYSGDVTPNPYWQAALLEIDYPAGRSLVAPSRSYRNTLLRR